MSMVGGMAVIGVVGVVTPLDLPDSQLGESPITEDVNDGRRSYASVKEKPSEREGQPRSEDSGEKVLQSVSSGGRCSSKDAPMVAIVEGDAEGMVGEGIQGLKGRTLLLPYTNPRSTMTFEYGSGFRWKKADLRRVGYGP